MADGIGMTTLAFGFIAIASSLFMSISPIPFFWRILKNKNTQEFHYWPFAASCISHSIWIAYWINSDRDGDVPYVIQCLSVCCWTGMIFDFSYLIVYLCCTNQRNQIIMACIYLSWSFTFFLGIVLLYPHLDESARKVFLGTLGVISGILMYVSPLSNIVHVYRTKSSNYMPFVRCITMYLNCICWLIFTCMKESFDFYIVITNGLGIFLGLVPLSVLYKFYETPPKSLVAKRLEATLDVDPREEIVVLNKICPRCKYIMFEHKEKIKLNRDTKLMLYQIDGSKSWRVNAATTETGILESYKGVSQRFDKLSTGADQV